MKLNPAIAPMVMALTIAYSANSSAANGDPVKRALGHINSQGRAVEKSTGDQFLAKDVKIDSDGSEHVRFDRTYKGLGVIGGDIVVHSKGNGAFRSASHTLHRPINIDTTAHIDETDAISLAETEFDLDAARNAPSTSKLVVYARDEVPLLAWDVRVMGDHNNGTPSEAHYIVDANVPQIIDQWDDIETSVTPGTGSSFFSGSIGLTTDLTSNYALRDPTRGNQYTTDMKNKQSGSGSLFTDADNFWGDGTLVNRQTVAVDAQYGTAVTWDYYKNVHGRNGIANNGGGAFNRVHYGSKYNNAFWSESCFCMTYGDGDGVTFNPFDSLDVAGHEMSHGVTSRTANLIYSGESGGLNEATSDIFGTMVEYYANNVSDTPDYLIGEKLYKSGSQALRYMYNPSLDGKSASCWSSAVGGLDVHYSSGVANHFFYLLAEGSVPTIGPVSPTCNGSAVSGIGRNKAEKIWYRALTVYMTSSTNFVNARVATLNAAGDLYGVGSPEQAAAASAWSAVNVN
jgi:zinc metalloprotease ZmpA